MPALCTKCLNSLSQEEVRCASCQQGDRLPWEAPHFPDTSLERALFALSVVRADGGPSVDFPLAQGEVLLSAEAAPLPEGRGAREAVARICPQEDGLFIEALGARNGLFRRIHSEEALLLPCELRMGSHHFLLEELEASRRPSRPEFWGASPAPFRARLLDLIEGSLIGDGFLLREGINVVGREKGDIVCCPTDNFISGCHAQFDVQGNLILLSDLGSSNGTFVRVHGPHPIFDGDQFLMGPHLLKFSLKGE